MSKTVESYNYKIGLDVSQLKAGGILTRQELGYLRRDFGRLQEPGERAAKTLERLHNAYEKGGLDAKTYAEAVARINAKLPANIEAQKNQAAAEKQAAEIKRKLVTEEQRYAAELAHVAELVKTTNLTRKEAAAHLREFKSQMPSAIAAQREQNEAEREAAAIRKTLTTDAERYASESHRLKRLVDAGTLSRQHATEALRRYRAQLPSVTAAERSRSELQRRGSEITEKYRTDAERLTRTLADERRELERLHRAGQINNETYRRGRADLAERARPSRPDMGTTLARIPALSGIAGAGENLMALGPQLAMLAAGIGGIVIAYKAASAAARAFTAGTIEQANELIELDRAAKILKTDLESLIGFQYAASSEAGLNADQSLKIVTKLSGKISEAAAGGGDALATLEFLGLSAERLAEMDPAAALREVVEVASKIENPIDRSRVAMKLFEEEGIALATVLEGGAAGLDKAAAEAERLGLMVSGVDAAGLKLASDEIGNLRATWDGWTRQTAVEFAPVVTAIAQTVSEMVPNAGEFGDAIEVAADAAVVLSSRVAQTAEDMRVAWEYANLFTAEGAAKYATQGLPQARDMATEMWNKYQAAKEEAARRAEENKRDAETAKPQTGPDEEQTKSYTNELKELRSRNMLLRRGEEGAAEYNLKRADIDPSIKEEIRGLRERNELLQRENEITERERSLEKQIELAEQLKKVQADRPELDAETAKERAELQLLDATAEQLRHHLKLRRDIAAIEANNKATEEEAKRIKKLGDEAKGLKESYRLPAEKLAADFRKLDEMRRRDLLTAEQHARATKEATEAAMVDEEPQATRALDVNDGGGFYAAMVEEQQARRKADAQQDEAQRLRAAAIMLNHLAHNRLETETAVTENMRAQAEIAGRIAEVGNRTTATNTQTTNKTESGTNDQLLTRIATAAEATAATLDDWQIIGV
ncbi:hypothetical protein [Allorhodopirellula heiligendammensis]|uniref:Uncharacterized protein n=1 Tax=Allorhodopirellula heiligendammensis TaxID=2714739 RepID=A0A5C6C6A7_9BACT|nr:hypothetical protein [Allorhodopirellula heiligendammensis]TWU19567.1 hypothetical protein Poly21_17410 [Allorhodopirellula heiligendammensis]